MICGPGIGVHVGVLDLDECLQYWSPKQDGQCSETSQVVVWCVILVFLRPDPHSWWPGIYKFRAGLRLFVLARSTENRNILARI